jgi:hypothetical protein
MKSNAQVLYYDMNLLSHIIILDITEQHLAL